MSAEYSLSMRTTLPGYGSWLTEPAAPVRTPAQIRSDAWLAWMQDVRAKLLRTAGRGSFFAHHWAGHVPALLPVERSPATRWTLETLRDSRAGQIEVEVQTGRTSDPNYEARSHEHKGRMRFADFLDLVENGPPNDVYMTANNTAANAGLLAALAPEVAPLPEVLRPDPAQGFLWIGRDTLTPMHHDLTQNIMIQLVGTKVVRLVPPSEQPKLGNVLHVFADFRWLDDALARSRDIAFTEIVLTPGQALFLPVGWWHCVQANGFSVTYTSTNFHWPNNWTEGFP